MRIFQPLCVAMLALSASAWSVAAGADAGKPQEADEHVTIDESINLNNNTGWETPDLPYARLLANSGATAAPPWSSTSARQRSLAPPHAVTAPAAQQANMPAPVPEASMISMLLVGLGLLAFGMHGERQDKFDS